MPRAKNGSSTKIGVVWQKSDFLAKNRNFGPKKRHSLFSPKHVLATTGVSILMSYGENPHYVKLPIFSEIMENSTKFMENSDLTKWTQNLS